MSSNDSTSQQPGTEGLVSYLCESAITAMRAGDFARAETFLHEASLELPTFVEQVHAAELAAEQAEQHAAALRLHADGLRKRAYRASRRVERLARMGLVAELATPAQSDVRALLRPLAPLALGLLVFLGACAPADENGVQQPAVHFPVSTYVAGVAGAELGALQGALAAANSACVPWGAESNTAPTPLFWAHYEATPADTCGALSVRVGDVAGAAELVARPGCLPELVLGAGVDAETIAAELSVFTLDRPELVCSP